MSNDLDFIEEGLVSRAKRIDALRPLGFVAGKGRHFEHPQSPFFIEFPPGPLMVGHERVERVSERRTSAGMLRLLAPTDWVKDRLAAFFHWDDRQALEQALLVAAAHRIDLAEVRRWARGEGQEPKFDLFHGRLQPKPRKQAPREKSRRKRRR